MHPLKIATAVFATLALGAGFAAAKSHGNDLVMSSKLNGVVFIMNEQHMSLYFYDKDEAGVSNCYGDCAASWPPALLEADADMPENYTLIERADGTMQIAFKNQPLYQWIDDAKIGDTGGDGIGGVWRLAVP